MNFTYRIERKIGEGGFGAVFVGYQNETNGRVAIKFLRRATPDAVERLRREARILQRIYSPYIIRLIDYSFSGPRPFIVLEFCQFGNLQAWVAERRSLKAIVDVLVSVGAAMNEIHRQGGFHRDIKPSNIFLQRNPHGGVIAKLGDFGLARTAHTVGPYVTRGPYGTPGYMAPELMWGSPYDLPCDVYSFGITAMELLTGAKNPNLLFTPWIPEDLRSLLLATIHGNPHLRPTGNVIVERLMRIAKQLPPEPATPANFFDELVKISLVLGGGIALAKVVGGWLSRDR